MRWKDWMYDADFEARDLVTRSLLTQSFREGGKIANLEWIGGDGNDGTEDVGVIKNTEWGS
jgi:hypothetical protein